MSGFSADWLSLREVHDRAARNPSVLAKVARAFAGRTSIAVVDLGCGTGATLRAVSPHLPAQQSWRMVDNDLGLLARAPASPPSPGLTMSAMPVDLARDVEVALDGVVDLVTMSAVLDLVSGSWLERLAIEALARGLPIYAALTYDGRMGLSPEDELDQRVVAAVNRHQLTDKGFGPALGPAAAGAAVAILQRFGYTVESGRADWRLGPQDKDIQLELLSGCATAAREMGDISLPDLMNWLTRRRDMVAADASSMVVGHVDLFARTTATRWGDRSQSNNTSSPMG